MTHRSNSVSTNKGGKHPILIPTRKKRLHVALAAKEKERQEEEEDVEERQAAKYRTSPLPLAPYFLFA